MRAFFKSGVALVVTCGLLLLTNPAAAVSCAGTTCTLTGDNVVFEYDIVTNASALALFGTPTIQGDTIRFLPPSFRAGSVDGAAPQSVGSSFVFDRVYSLSGADISVVSLLGFGDAEVRAGDTVSASMGLIATSNAGGAAMVSDDDSYFASGDTGGLQTWQLNAGISPGQGLGIGNASDIRLTIEGLMQAATSQPGESAFAQDKLIVFDVVTVPVPAALWLFPSGLGLFLGYQRRLSGRTS